MWQNECVRNSELRSKGEAVLVPRTARSLALVLAQINDQLGRHLPQVDKVSAYERCRGRRSVD